MKFSNFLLAVVAAVPAAFGQTWGTATVSLAFPSGTPAQLGSGILYGIPVDNSGYASSQIPSSLYTEIGFNYGRAGGAAWGSPNRGWSFSEQEYAYRFTSTLSNYRTTRQNGGKFFLLPHDLWGIDSDGRPYPGDDDDWSYYDAFLDRMISDIKANNMVDGLVIDIWNEPDAAYLFWRRSQEQYRAMWGHTYYRLRRDLPSTEIAGPATSYGAGDNNPTFSEWASFVAQNGSIPDIYTWHALNKATSPTDEYNRFQALRAANGLPERPININEYLAYDEEGPGPVTYYLGQLERLNMRGVKANWAKYGANAVALHNYLANILGAENADSPSEYYPNGEWQVYKYYAGMKGERVATKPSSDGVLEVFATRGPAIKILTAARLSTNPYSMTLTGFRAVGITGSTVTKQARGFPWGGVFGQVTGPIDYGTEVHTITNDAVTFNVYPNTPNEAYAFEFFA